MDDNNKDTNAFRDFIPAGEDPGAITEDGFQDFVPTYTPKPQQVAVEPLEPQTEEVAQQEPAPVQEEAAPQPQVEQPQTEERNKGIFDNIKARFAGTTTTEEEPLTPVTEEMTAQDQANLSEPFNPEPVVETGEQTD
jgi:hypothetical protein